MGKKNTRWSVLMTQILEGDDDWDVGGLMTSKEGLAPSIRGMGALVIMNSIVTRCQYVVISSCERVFTNEN